MLHISWNKTNTFSGGKSWSNGSISCLLDPMVRLWIILELDCGISGWLNMVENCIPWVTGSRSAPTMGAVLSSKQRDLYTRDIQIPKPSKPSQSSKSSKHIQTIQHIQNSQVQHDPTQHWDHHTTQCSRLAEVFRLLSLQMVADGDVRRLLTSKL